MENAEGKVGSIEVPAEDRKSVIGRYRHDRRYQPYEQTLEVSQTATSWPRTGSPEAPAVSGEHEQ
jgi:hypothetical protein